MRYFSKRCRASNIVNVVKTRVQRVLTSMLKIQNNVSAIVSQNDPKFIGDMISAKICQKIIILSAI